MTRDLTLNDFADNGRLDVVFVNQNQPNRVCVNDGTGNFSNCADTDGLALNSQGVTSAFFGPNGDVDFFEVNSGAPNRICYGVLPGPPPTFTCSNVNGDTFNSRGADNALLNTDDAFPDVVVANFNEENIVCLNDGLGLPTSFTCNPVDPSTTHSNRVALKPTPTALEDCTNCLIAAGNDVAIGSNALIDPDPLNILPNRDIVDNNPMGLISVGDSAVVTADLAANNVTLGFNSTVKGDAHNNGFSSSAAVDPTLISCPIVACRPLRSAHPVSRT